MIGLPNQLVIRFSTQQETIMTEINNENNSSTSAPAPKKIPTFVKWAIGLDIAWAALVATFAATVFNTAGGAAGATSTAISLGTISAWLIAFVIGLMQGAVFIAVLSVFAWVGINLFASTKRSQ
jgi:hypothetical protein